MVVALSKDGENGLNLLDKPPNLPRPAKNVLKIDSCSALGGAIGVLGGALTNFPRILCVKYFFHRLGVQVQPASTGPTYA